MPHRTFLALDVGPESREQMAALAARLNVRGAKIGKVRPENLHVTLNFLGDVEDEQLSEVCRTAERVAAEAEPFKFGVTGVQCIPPGGTPRMIWVGVDDPSGRLCLLQQRLAAALAALGFPPERRAYRPHVTLARIRFARDAVALRRAVEAVGETDFGRHPGEEVVVYLSKLGPGGPVYTPAARLALGGAGDPPREV